MKTSLNNAFGNTFLEIEYDEANKWVYNNWMGYQSLGSVMQGANECIKMLQRFRCACLLNDNRLVVGPWNHATDWIAHNWTPRAIAAGLTHFANIVSPEALARLSAEEMNTKISGFFNMQIFADIETAKKWLQQKQ